MTTDICSSCIEACKVKMESGEFDANGPRGTIKGNHGDVEISDCCGEPVEQIDSDLFEYWEELKRLAEDNDMAWLVSDYPESHQVSFDEGITPQELIDAKIRERLANA